MTEMWLIEKNEFADQQPKQNCQQGKTDVEEDDVDEIGKIVEFMKSHNEVKRDVLTTIRKSDQKQLKEHENPIPNTENLTPRPRIRIRCAARPLPKSQSKIKLNTRASMDKEDKRISPHQKSKSDSHTPKLPIKESSLTVKPRVNSKLQKEPEISKALDTSSKRKKGQKPSKIKQVARHSSVQQLSPKHYLDNQEMTQTESTEGMSGQSKKLTSPKQEKTSSSCYFKPIQNWHKVLRMPTNYGDFGSKLTENQIYKNALPPYVPCVPPNTSQRVIDSLSAHDVDQISCPGCKDRFLLPTSFYHHLYRRSVMITFTCGPCGDATMTFYNKCHLRVHVLTHLEADGLASVSVVQPDTLSVVPLDQQHLDVGFLGAPSVDHIEQLFSEGSTDNCPECGLNLGAYNIKGHYSGSGDRVAFKKCQFCSMHLPSDCAIKAHERIHDNARPPMVCPECGTLFETRDMFIHHLRHSCMHEGRCLAFRCKLCKKEKSGSQLIDKDSLANHIFQHHVKTYFKCSDCAKAFLTSDALGSHRSSVHSSEPIGDCRHLYKAKFLPRRSILYVSRKEIEDKVGELISSWKPLQYMFKCHSCQCLFEGPDELRNHNTRWCQLQTGVKANGILFNLKTNRSMSPEEVAQKEKFNRIQTQIKHLKKTCLSGGQESDEFTKKCSDILDLLSRQATSHLKPGNVMNGCEADKKCDELGEPKKALFESPPPSGYDDKFSEDFRITRRRIIGSPLPATITPLKATSVVEAPKQQPNDATIETPAEAKIEQPKAALKKPISDKKKGHRSRVIEPLVESLGRDMLSNRSLLSVNKLSRQSLTSGSVVVSDANTREEVSFKCGICSLVTQSKEDFQIHIATHRPSGGAVLGTDFLQCKLCGMCFASEASWRKHLLILHRVKKPSPDFYCEDLPTTMAALEGYTEDSPELSRAIGDGHCSSADGDLIIDEDVGQDANRLQATNTCSVCQETFKDSQEYKKHMRTHGMAFLKMKRRSVT